MPWPVTHILIAEKIFHQHFDHLDHQAFIIGTCFPDIRYPAKINRDRTHHKIIHLSDIRTTSPFQVGLSCHSLVDAAWNRYIHANYDSLFAEIPHSRPMFHTMKILQDAFLYEDYAQWDQIAALFSTILTEEQNYGVSQQMVNHWHTMLAHYVSKPPRFEDLQMLYMSLPESLVKEIILAYQNYRCNRTLIRIMRGFFQAFDQYLALPEG